MRNIKLTKDDVDLEYSGHGNEASLTGTDELTGDRVTLVFNDGELVNDLLAVIARDGSIVVPVGEHRVTNIEPTSGQWDSPGTSPEEPGS